MQKAELVLVQWHRAGPSARSSASAGCPWAAASHLVKLRDTREKQTSKADGKNRKTCVLKYWRI